MSDFVEILTLDTGVGKGAWQASGLGDWLFISDGWMSDQGFRVNRSNKGNPFMIKVHKEYLGKFIEFLQKVACTEVAQDADNDAPF